MTDPLATLAIVGGSAEAGSSTSFGKGFWSSLPKMPGTEQGIRSARPALTSIADAGGASVSFPQIRRLDPQLRAIRRGVPSVRG